MASIVFATDGSMLSRMPYAAYGSNLLHAQMTARVGESKFVGTGSIKNMRLTFAKHATIERDKQSIVPVGLWMLNEKQVAKLDRYEGHPNVYVRTLVLIHRPNGKSVIGYTYIMRKIRQLMPSLTYLDKIERGYEDCGLDKAYLSRALETLPAEVEEPVAETTTRYVSRGLLTHGRFTDSDGELIDEEDERTYTDETGKVHYLARAHRRHDKRGHK